MQVKLCRDCIHGTKQTASSWKMNCQNPKVNRKDAYALAYADFVGSDTIDERRKTSWWAACGQSGKQWKAKDASI